MIADRLAEAVTRNATAVPARRSHARRQPRERLAQKGRKKRERKEQTLKPDEDAHLTH